MSAPIRKRDGIIVNGALWTRRRPKRTWMEVAKVDMIVVNLTENMTLNNLMEEKKIM